jgi:hypothetical protein
MSNSSLAPLVTMLLQAHLHDDFYTQYDLCDLNVILTACNKFGALAKVLLLSTFSRSVGISAKMSTNV